MLTTRSVFIFARIALYCAVLNYASHMKHHELTAAVWCVLGFEAFVQVCELSSRRGKASALRLQAERAPAEARAIEVQKMWTTEDLPTVHPDSLILHAHERCVLKQEAIVYAPVTITSRRGGSRGVSVPVGHTGIRLRVGEFASHPVSTTQIAEVNRGTLYLTTKRIVVLGMNQTTQVLFTRILTLDVKTNGVVISMANGKPLSLVTGTAQLGIYARRLLAPQTAAG